MNYLFPELEAIMMYAENKEEEKEVTVNEHKRKAKKKMCQSPSDTPVAEIDHTENAPSSFTDKNGVKYIRIEDKVINKVVTIPAKIVVEAHHYAQYKAEAEGFDNVILYDNKVLDGIAASPALLADIVVKKFDDYLPLYRQQEIYQRMGLYLTRQKMARWLISSFEQMQPLSELFKKEIYSMNLLTKDETKVQVLDFKTNEGRVSANSFMYITIGSSYSEEERTQRDLVLVDYIQGRTIDVLMDDLRRFNYKGMILTDGLKGYRHYEGQHATCWVHAVRDFKKLLKALEGMNKAVKEKDPYFKTKHNDYAYIVSKVALLFKIDEEERAKLYSGEIDSEAFLRNRKARSMIVIDELYGKLHEMESAYIAVDEAMKAIKYFFEYEKELRTYLECVEATPSTNAAERIAKAFATGRKNFLFCQSIDGADASAFFFSLVESAKLQHINVCDYIEYVFTFAPACKSEDDWKDLLPWNADLGKLDKFRTARANAKADEKRCEPYIFCGANR